MSVLSSLPKPKNVDFVLSQPQLAELFEAVILRKTGVKVDLYVGVDAETFGAFVRLADEEAVSEEDYDILGEAGYNFEEWYETADLLLSQLFDMKMYDVSAYSDEGEVNDDNYYLFTINIPYEHYRKLVGKIEEEMSNTEILCPDCGIHSSVFVKSGTLVTTDKGVQLLQAPDSGDPVYTPLIDSGVSLDEIGECSQCNEKFYVSKFIVPKF